MTNPTGAENARVQDAADRVIDIAIEANASHEEIMDMRKALAAALREAEQRGMRRAEKMARLYGSLLSGVEGPETAESIANIIERAATQED